MVNVQATKSLLPMGPRTPSVVIVPDRVIRREIRKMEGTA
jgi:hypothetical protein